MSGVFVVRGIVALFACAVAVHAADPAPSGEEVTDWRRLAQVVKPAAGESPWREIAWLTDVSEARRRAVAEDKPLVVFTAADGSPLGRT